MRPKTHCDLTRFFTDIKIENEYFEDVLKKQVLKVNLISHLSCVYSVREQFFEEKFLL